MYIWKSCQDASEQDQALQATAWLSECDIRATRQLQESSTRANRSNWSAGRSLFEFHSYNVGHELLFLSSGCLAHLMMGRQTSSRCTVQSSRSHTAHCFNCVVQACISAYCLGSCVVGLTACDSGMRHKHEVIVHNLFCNRLEYLLLDDMKKDIFWWKMADFPWCNGWFLSMMKWMISFHDERMMFLMIETGKCCS